MKRRKFRLFDKDMNSILKLYFQAFPEDVEDLDFTVEKENDLDQPDAGTIADALKNDPSIYGKHISLFLQ